MKKRYCLLLATLLLCGCVAPAPAELPAESAEIAAAPTPESVAPSESAALTTLAPELTFPRTTRADALAMTNLMSVNRFLFTDDTLYGLDVDAAGAPQLVSWQLTDGQLSDCRTLAEGVAPEWLCQAGETLYWSNAAAGGRLERMDLAAESAAVEILLDERCSFLQIVEDTLYFCDGAQRFCRLTAEGDAEVLIETAVWYPYLHGGVLLYQNAADGETLHLRELETGEDRRLNDVASYAPLCLDKVIWYSQRSGDGCVMASLDLRSGRGERYDSFTFRGEAQFLRDGGKWCARVFDFSPAITQLSGPLTGPWQQIEGDLYRMCDYLGEELRVDALYQKDGRLFCFALAEENGGEQRFVSGAVFE